MVKTALSDSKHGHNCYIEGRTVRPDLANEKRGKLSDTTAVFALVIDSDADKGMAATVTAQPTMVVETSLGNEHMWFCLERAISADEAKSIGAAMRKAAGADHDTGNPVQPYRVAGTTNYPSDLKRARGRITRPTRLIEHSGRTWTPEELLEAFKSSHQERAKKKPDGPKRDPNGHYQSDLPLELYKLILNGATEGDRSTQFHRAVAWLKRLGRPLDAIVELFERHPDGIAGKYAGRIRDEVARSFDKIHTDADDSRENIVSIPESDRPCYHVFDEWMTVAEAGRVKPGVWYFGVKRGKGEEAMPILTQQYICSPLRITAVTSNEHGNEFGRLLLFINTNGQEREWPMPMETLAGSGEPLRAELFSMGVNIDPHSRMLFGSYLQNDVGFSKLPRIQCTTQVGWCGDAFVCPTQ